MAERKLTELEEQVYRACSEDFDGLSELEAAEGFGTTQQKISEILKAVYKKCPSLPKVHWPKPSTVSFDGDFMSDDIREKF